MPSCLCEWFDKKIANGDLNLWKFFVRQLDGENCQVVHQLKIYVKSNFNISIWELFILTVILVDIFWKLSVI